MKKVAYLFSLLVGFALASAVGVARADTIGGPGSGCGSCNDASYTLFTNFVDTNPDPNLVTYRVSLLIDTSTLNIAAVEIDAFAIKIASSISGFDIVSAPGGPWTTHLNDGLNANGCSGGGSGFGCADTTFGNGATTGGTVEFVVDITFDAGTLVDPASIKVLYVDANGNKIGSLVSENITLQTSPCVPGTEGCRPPFLIPEPSTLALLGMSLLVLGYTVRRRHG